jgi:Mlc titration factor MtfA (ptsG expression regulator)
MNSLSRMTANELSAVLNITEETVKHLAKTGQLPHMQEKNQVYFNFHEIIIYFRQLKGGAA